MAGKRIIVFSLLALVGLALAVFASSGTQAQSYKRLREYSLSNLTASAATDSIDYTASAVPDYNYEDSSMYTLTPIDLYAVPGTTLPIGAGVGVLASSSTVGLLGGPCGTALPPSFSLYNATVDTSNELDPQSLYWVLKKNNFAAIQYRMDCDDNMDDDGDTLINDGCPAEGPAETTCGEASCDDDIGYRPWDNCDDDGDGYINDGCAAVGDAEYASDINLPDYLEGYPHFVNDGFDPDGPSGPEPPLQPSARYAGHAFVASSNILIQLLVFTPGQLEQMGGLYGELDASVGGVTIVMLNNPVNQEEAPGSISDFCTPLETTTTVYGTTTDHPDTAADESGYANQNNPPAGAGVMGTGTLIARNYSRAERDADGDGYENDFDPCHYTADPGWDQRDLTGAIQPGLDTDGDGLADSCDPDITGTTGDPDLIDCVGTQTDCDGDGYDNRQDICPLVPNGCIVEGCSDAFPPIYNANWDNQADSESVLLQDANADMGPNPDSIGDACDDSDDDGLEAGGGTTAGSGDCDDGIDNDLDNKIDGNDPDCQPYMDQGEIALGHSHADIWGTNPSDGQFYHSMGWAAACVGATDSDGDGYCDDLETALGSPTNNGAESGTDCDNAADDDSDGYVNDGCPMVDDEIERGAECANATDDDTGDADGKVNDGCPVIGVPESLVMDTGITLTGALPTAAAPESCNDGIDNDGDTLIDALDNSDLGCDPTDDSYATDPDHDGHNPDNCPTVWNPEQVDTDGDGDGDVCDDDDDDDGYSDVDEWHMATDSLADCPTVVSAHDAWPLDVNADTYVTVGGDVLPYRGNIGKQVSAPGNSHLRRLDLNHDDYITVGGDVLPFRGNIGAHCT
jgi:hypothetical protein